MSKRLQRYLLNECLYEGAETIVYRARRPFDLSSVIIKTTKAEQPSPEQIIRLYHEYDILQSLNGVAGVAHACALEHDRNSVALILEDCDGLSLREIIGSLQIAVLVFLPIAIQLAEILHEIHQRGVIHKNINPGHILLIPNTFTVKLIDFSIASRVSTETPATDAPDLPHGILAYLSPEQAQKISWSLDHRTDFYSLGITFYELLTGHLPFSPNHAPERSHCHLRHHPVPPDQMFPEIPEAVSTIVMKLMAKRAKDRYQNALELKNDLETCLYSLQSCDRIAAMPHSKTNL